MTQGYIANHVKMRLKSLFCIIIKNNLNRFNRNLEFGERMETLAFACSCCKQTLQYIFLREIHFQATIAPYI